MSTIKKLKPQLREDQRMRRAAAKFHPRNMKEAVVANELAKIVRNSTMTGEQKTVLFADGAALMKRINLND